MDTAYLDLLTIQKLKFFGVHQANDREMYFDHPVIGYLLKGTGKFLYKGKNYYAKEGDLIYIARGTKYYSIWYGEPKIEFYSMNFRFSNRLAYDEFRFQIVKNFPKEPIDKVYLAFEENQKMKALSMAYLFLEEVYKALKKTKNTDFYERILPAVNYIEERSTDSVSVLELAKLCHLSESRFFALFKLNFGQTPIQYKNAVRVKMGIDLLSQTDLSVEEIAEKLNFSSPAYFRRQLKAVVDLTPKQIRNFAKKST